MNTDTSPEYDPFLRLRDCADKHLNAVLIPTEAEWVLAQIKHRDDRIAALTGLLHARSLPTPVAVAGPSAPFAAPDSQNGLKGQESVCAEADRIVATDRQNAYGHPVFNFTRTARIWEVVLDRPAGEITPEQVGLCMIGTKLARHLHHPKRDNLTDIAGYAKTVQMCADYDANEDL